MRLCAAIPVMALEAAIAAPGGRGSLNDAATFACRNGELARGMQYARK